MGQFVFLVEEMSSIFELSDFANAISDAPYRANLRSLDRKEWKRECESTGKTVDPEGFKARKRKERTK
jgi:hypothetical protein